MALAVEGPRAEGLGYSRQKRTCRAGRERCWCSCASGCPQQGYEEGTHPDQLICWLQCETLAGAGSQACRWAQCQGGPVGTSPARVGCPHHPTLLQVEEGGSFGTKPSAGALTWIHMRRHFPSHPTPSGCWLAEEQMLECSMAQDQGPILHPASIRAGRGTAAVGWERRVGG